MSDKYNISNRKKEHLKLAISKYSRYKELTTGFENYRFVHCALPEIDFSEVCVESELLGYNLSCPLIINPISGGEETGKALNRDLAIIAARQKVALSLGSIRPALENTKTLETYQVVVNYTNDIPLIANIGCLQLKNMDDYDKILSIIKKLHADAISVHLNPLQEVLQPEGGTNFKGILQSLQKFIKYSDLPVIVKEVGFGMSSQIIQKLVNIGCEWIDISGSGGTNWARIEAARINKTEDRAIAREFGEWGIPTAQSLHNAHEYKKSGLIASGGLDTGLQFAKALALGADLGGIAGSVVRAWYEDGSAGVANLIKKYRKVLKICLFSTGMKNIQDFCYNSDIIKRIDQ